MTRLAVIDLDVPGSNRKGRVFLDRSLLKNTSTEELEAELGRNFIEKDDEARMLLIEALLCDSEVLQVAIHPGESSPPEYHAFIKSPGGQKTRLFACVLAPAPVVTELLLEAPHILFETGTFQAMPADTSPSSLATAFEAWARRVWPGIELPRFELRPWPIEDVLTRPVALPVGKLRKAPLGAQDQLPNSDYPTADELIA